jgi:hypothetical protein
LAILQYFKVFLGLFKMGAQKEGVVLGQFWSFSKKLSIYTGPYNLTSTNDCMSNVLPLKTFPEEQNFAFNALTTAATAPPKILLPR